jgi:hypothetical protein
MRIAVRYIGTSKTGVITYAIFADDLRVGLIKNDGSSTLKWRAVVPVYLRKLLPKHRVGHFESEYEAAKAILVFYKQLCARALVSRFIGKKLQSIRYRNRTRRSGKYSDATTNE